MPRKIVLKHAQFLSDYVKCRFSMICNTAYRTHQRNRKNEKDKNKNRYRALT